MSRPNDRRQHKRFPVLYALAKPVLLRPSPKARGGLPGIMANLSEGGMALIAFEPVQPQTPVEISFQLKNLRADRVPSRIVWLRNNGGSYAMGIRFERLPAAAARKIRRMADDFDACEARIVMGVKPVCVRGCSYYDLCAKTAKGRYE